ncbi:Hypothetical protein SMAX5B_018973 [Scophthalmus maximus]|uniref:Uncharacterized protein n=1 Tax=Scophthalmus maximus TaxID=52904 RepID=A0A2U9C7Q1_SCOMX|nr:Hypothetical protein SMAX5B_018973 [Scophthalmus maximus]
MTEEIVWRIFVQESFNEVGRSCDFRQKENGAPVRGGLRGDNSPEEIEERMGRNEVRGKRKEN